MGSTKVKTIKNNGAGFVWPQREYFVMALIATPVIVVLFAIGAFDDLPLNLVDVPLAFILYDAAMFYLGTICFRLSEEGVVQYNFGVKTRRILWSDVDQVGTGYTGSGAAIVITLKGNKRYVPLKDSGRVRDAEWFSMLNHKGCILIKKASMARALVEKFYGELDYEWNPPNYD